ncbi:MAG: cell division protein FtsH [Parcubacteria group bacterium CG11_big_fil_rev_8_21_14_0_20_39_14]|nr:MAG: cell division protein FtsH [Parcubacteria group bacterium CG11_big_fil_rev_8_21_14_0_20_39_14]
MKEGKMGWLWLIWRLVRRFIFRRSDQKTGEPELRKDGSKKFSQIFREKKVFIITAVLVSLLVLGGTSFWIHSSIENARRPEKQTEQFFVDEVLPNTKDVVYLEEVKEKLQSDQIESVYIQGEPRDPYTFMNYYLKYKGEEDYHLLQARIDEVIVLKGKSQKLYLVFSQALEFFGVHQVIVSSDIKKEVLPNIRGEITIESFEEALRAGKIEIVYLKGKKDEQPKLTEYVIKLSDEEKGYYLLTIPADYMMEFEYTPSEKLMELRVAFESRGVLKRPVPPNPKGLGVTTEPWFQIAIILLVVSGLTGGFYFIWRRQMGGGGFLKAKGRKITIPVTFSDVAGIDEAKEETWEMIEYLKDPKPYQELCAKLIKGVLLYGPPGTGKTLLARAIAGEANIPYKIISGSEFHEMFVGVGASRARKLFEEATKLAPYLIIIDELDSAAPKRSAGLEVHPEATSLVNQLLSLLDTLEKEDIPVFVIGITNRPDMLDPALLRPGRFDRHIEIPLPTAEGRAAILRVHIERPKPRPVDPDLDFTTVVKETQGFSGAHLAALVNEASLRAVREKRKIIILEDFQQSIERVLMGPEKKLKLTDKEKEIIAWHESGHALIGKSLPETDPLQFITILPRGKALGHTRFLPAESHITSEDKLFNEIKIFMGGRAAEEIRFGKRSSGAAGDIEIATSLARSAVCVLGMSELGPIRVADSGGAFYSPFLWSENFRQQVDEEIKRILNDCYRGALELLRENEKKLNTLARALLESPKKRLVESEIDEIINNA